MKPGNGIHLLHSKACCCNQLHLACWKVIVDSQHNRNHKWPFPPRKQFFLCIKMHHLTPSFLGAPKCGTTCVPMCFLPRAPRPSGHSSVPRLGRFDLQLTGWCSITHFQVLFFGEKILGPWILWGLGPCCLSSALGHPNGKPVLPGRLDGETLQIQHENMNMDPFGISVTLMSCDSYMATKRRARSDMALLCKEGPIASTNTKSNWLFSTWNGRPGTWERKDANIEGDSKAQLARIAYSHAASYSVPPQAQVSFQPFIHERRSLPTFVFDSSQLSLAPTDPCIWIHLHVGTCASFGWPKTHNHKQLFIL